ncbi:MAG: zf-HC2 domain-containing protein [Anaerolineales bacterium]|nr:zf-HC2 domain-containing protein [Anaerolineales bacterium]
MSEHVTQWLSAYHDDELSGGRLHQVETHLAECVNCQEALADLQSLSFLLHEIPSPEFTSPERLSAQVNLRLPRKPVQISRHPIWEKWGWTIPVGILAMWVLVLAVGFLGGVVSTANQWGLLNTSSAGKIDVGAVQIETLPNWLAPSDTAEWSNVLGRFGLLNGNGLTQATFIESFVRSTLPQLVLQVAIALLYLSWFAIWWTYRTQEEPGRLLEVEVSPSKMK